MQLGTLAEVEERLFAAAPGAANARSLACEGELPGEDDVLLDLPISVYGGG